MSLPSFVSTLPGSTRQFLGNIFHKKNSGLRAQQQQQQSQSPSSNNHNPTTSSYDNNNNSCNDSTTNNNNIRNEKVAATPLPVSSTFLEKSPSTLGCNNSSTFSVLLPPVTLIADNLDYDYIHNNLSSNNSSRGSGSGTPVSESPPKLLILPPRRSSIGASTSGSITPPIPTCGISGAGVGFPTHASAAAYNTEPKNPSPLSPRSENTVFTQAPVTVKFTKFITNPTIPAPALTVATKPSINNTNNNGTGNTNSGLDSFYVDKDGSTEYNLLEPEALSPTTKRKKFDHFTFLRSSPATTATGGSGSILSTLAFSFKKQQNNNNSSNNNHSPSKLSLVTTQQSHQQQQQKNKKRQQDEQQSQPPQTRQQQQTLKSPRSQLFFMTGRTKKETVRPSAIGRLASKGFSSSSPSFSPDMSSSQAAETKSSTAAATTSTTTAATPLETTTKATTTTATTSRTPAVASPTRRSAVIKKKSLSKNQFTTKYKATTATDIPMLTPAATAENELVPSPLSMMHWPILPEVVVIPDLPKYIPNDSFGCNAKRNEKYARTRLVALRKHQQVLVGLLGDLLALDQQHREQQLVFKDPAHLVEKATVAAPSWKKRPISGSTSQAATLLTASSSKDPKAAEAETGEAGCGCDCQKRRRRQLQKRDSAMRAYQRAILDLWQADQNLCHWLSRYIRTTRHIGRRLDYMLAAMAENNNNSTCNGSATSSSIFKYPMTLSMTQEIVIGSHGVRVGTSGNKRPGSSVSNPELERMGILQSSLLGHSSTSLSLNDDSTGDSECQLQHLMSEALTSNEFIMESATLGMIDIGLSPSIHPAEQRIPTIEVDSPGRLSQPLPSLLDYRRSSITSITPSFTTTNSIPRAVAVTMRKRGPTRMSRVVTGPILSQAIRELVTSSAPLAPPPAIPPPKRPKPPTYPINIPSATRAPSIVSTSFFPSVPSPPASAMIAYSRTRPSFPLPPGFSASATGTFGVGAFRLSSPVRSPISNLAPILELDRGPQNLSVSLIEHCESESSRYSFTSATDPAVVPCAEGVSDNFIPPPRAMPTITPTPEAASPAPAPAATATVPLIPKTPTATNNATATAQMMLPDVDDYNDIEASVFVGYHLQSLSKANELLQQFNRESRRSEAVLQRFKAAKRAFKRRVVGLGLGLGAGSFGGEGSDGEGVGSAVR